MLHWGAVEQRAAPAGAARRSSGLLPRSQRVAPSGTGTKNGFEMNNGIA